MMFRNGRVTHFSPKIFHTRFPQREGKKKKKIKIVDVELIVRGDVIYLTGKLHLATYLD